jgi:two-component system sensor histidine kinase RegB
VLDASAVPRGIGLPWLATARWATLAAQAGAALMGATVLDVPVRWPLVAGVLGVTIVTNLWLSRQGARIVPGVDVPALLVVLDVVGLAIVLFAAGGPLNPVSIFLLVQITQAAFVHGARVAAVVAAVSTGLYGLLFVAVTPELNAALAMHPEVARHFQGMWWAFAATAALVTTFVARLARAVAQRDTAVRALEARLARTESLTRLATLAADAAHELGTPLGTIALTAGELERTLGTPPGDLSSALDDVRLIREESHRCRAMLDDMAGRAGQPAGGEPRAAVIGEVVARALADLPQARRRAVQVTGETDLAGRWPVEALGRALLNVLRNAFDASAPEAVVRVDLHREGAWLRLDVSDTGTGMADEIAAQAFEPFFTTRPGTGRGLGLVVVRQTVEMLGGHVDVASVPGAGTRVSLVVPVEVRA